MPHPSPLTLFPPTRKVTLRPYQQDFVEKIRTTLATQKRIIACGATGMGKTEVFVSITPMAITKGRTVLIITESTKIFPQIAERYPAIEINAGIKHVPLVANMVYIAMAQTLVRRPQMVEFFHALGSDLLVITDEAHVGTSTKLLQQLPDAYHIGFTATPDFRAAKHLPEIYNDIVVGPQPAELVELGFLSSYTHIARTRADLSTLIKNSRGDYSEESQEQAFEKAVVYEGLMQDLKAVPYKKALIFTASIGHCARLTEQLISDGYNAVAVHSQADPEALKAFTDGPVDICVSVGMLTKGFDYKPIDLVVLNRATTSLPLYLQMIGRGSRIIEGKTGFTVLDYGENWKRHQTWIMDREWEKMWSGKHSSAAGAAPVKDCPECGFLMPVSVMRCPGCGHVLEARAKTEEAPPVTELVDITAGFNLLKGRQVSTLTAEELATYAKTTGKKAFALRVAKARWQEGNHDFLKDYARHMEYKRGFYHMATSELIGEELIEFHDITIR